MNIVLFLGILLLLGLASTRAMKVFKLPNVTGYLIIGFISGLVCILIDRFSNDNTLTSELIELNKFVSTVALGFIALSIGQEFKISKLKKYGKKITFNTMFESIFTSILVDIVLVIVCLILGMNISVAIILGAIAAATAPAATIMVINQYKAKGELVDVLLPIVAGDDAIGLMIFSISVAIAKVIAVNASLTFFSVICLPIIEIVGSLIIGSILGFIMHHVIKIFKSRNNHEVLIIAFTLLGVGICEALNTIVISNTNLEFSNLLTCMMIGAVYVNLAKEKEKPIIDRDFELIDRWTPFLFMLFFVLSGTHLVTSAFELFKGTTLSKVTPILIIFISYLIIRSSGKYFGARIASTITKQSKDVIKYLGVTLLPQAGVAIGMANSISTNPSFSGHELGNIIVTVVLCGTLVYEIVGPLLTKWALIKAHQISEENI